MNKLLLLSIFSLLSTVFHAQNVIIDGVTFSADKKTLIKYPKDKIEREYVIPEGTEIIGKKAFEEAIVNKVTLPTTLTHINDSAFYSYGFMPYLVLTGKFPILGNHVFTKNSRSYFEVSKDSPYCVVDWNGIIYSKDKKILHIAPREASGCGLWDIEIIDRYAFQNCYIYGAIVCIPSSVLLIREHAFDDIEGNLPTRSEFSYENFQFNCDALVPPELEGEVFSKSNFSHSTLSVPKESEDMYKNASQWNTFGTIEGYIPGPPQGISQNTASALKVNQIDGRFYIEALKPMEKIRLVSLNGSIVHEEVITISNQTSYDIVSPYGFAGLLQVIYKDGSKYTVKLNF